MSEIFNLFKMQARPSLERGDVAEILDANLLTEPCNMEIMLKMGQLGLRCVEQNPKKRPKMAQVWQELEQALHSTDSFREPSMGSRASCYRSTDHGPRRSTDCESSQSFVSIDGVGFQRFRVEMDSLSFQSASLRCFQVDSVSIDIDNLREIDEEKVKKTSIGHM